MSAPRTRRESGEQEPGDTDRPLISDGVGASDDYSGGGNATGIPDADTAMREGGNPPAGNVEEDRKHLFPDAPNPSRHPGERS